MKKKLEVEIELPEYLNEDFIELLSMLDASELSTVKGVIIGILLGNGKYSVDEIRNISSDSFKLKK